MPPIRIAGRMISHLRRRATWTSVSNVYCLPGITGHLFLVDEWSPSLHANRNRLTSDSREELRRLRIGGRLVPVVDVLREDAEVTRDRDGQLRISGGREELAVILESDFALAAFGV